MTVRGMAGWLELASRIEALEAVALDAALVARCEARAPSARPIRFHLPTFKSYASGELAAPRGHAWPAVSITGPECALRCDHCRARVLEPMIAARTPEALWRVANDVIAGGARGMLLSGGSNLRDEIEYGPFLPTVRRIKDAWPGFRIAMHCALVDADMAQRIEAAGVDAVMLDIIGAQDTVAQVYHLRRPVEDFERSLAALAATSLKVVPHIVIGLHYGRLLGEWRALEIVARHRPAALVLVVAMPHYAAPARPFAVPAPAQAGRFFLDAREALGDLPLLLGCARPAGRARLEIDAYAVMAGLDGIAHPADGMVALASALGRRVKAMPSCCSIELDETAHAAHGVHAAEIDPRSVVAAERARGGARLAGIPVVQSS